MRAWQGLLDGAYRYEDKLGSGGFGSVHRAVEVLDEEVIQTVAVKLFRAEVVASQKKRILREAQALYSLRDIPGVVRLIRIGKTHDSIFLCMEYVAGEPLSERLARSGRLSLSYAVSLGASVARTLAACHQSGVTHRDLKPSNIMLTNDSNRKVVLIDFGIVKLSDCSSTNTQLVGTPAYMPPEQIEGKSADHRIDIFALGVLLYESIAGQRPLPAEPQEQLDRNLNDIPPSLREHLPDAPEAVASLLAKMMEKDPACRPQDMMDVYRQLTAIAGGLEDTSPAGDAEIEQRPVTAANTDDVTRTQAHAPSMPRQVATSTLTYAGGGELRNTPPTRRPLPGLTAAGALLIAVVAVGWALFHEDSRETRNIAVASQPFADKGTAQNDIRGAAVGAMDAGSKDAAVADGAAADVAHPQRPSARSSNAKKTTKKPARTRRPRRQKRNEDAATSGQRPAEPPASVTPPPPVKGPKKPKTKTNGYGDIEEGIGLCAHVVRRCVLRFLAVAKNGTATSICPRASRR
jgi:serine/threonine protein kinase